jgi:hypothetical protein
MIGDFEDGVRKPTKQKRKKKKEKPSTITMSLYKHGNYPSFY